MHSNNDTPEADKPVLTVKHIAILLPVAIVEIVLLIYYYNNNCNLMNDFIYKFFGISFFAVSAFLWLCSALIPTPLPMAYASGPPKKVVKRSEWQARCNKYGAIFTALGLILQNL